MFRIDYHCGFLDSERSLFVFSEKIKDEEVERLNRLKYVIHAITEEQ